MPDSAHLEREARELRAFFAMNYAKDLADLCHDAANKARELCDPATATYFEGMAAEFRDVERLKRAAANIEGV